MAYMHERIVRELSKDFILGLYTFLSPNMISIIVGMFFLLFSPSMWFTWLLCEAIIDGFAFARCEESNRKKLVVRLVFSRMLTWWLIYSEALEVPYIWWLFLPTFLSWYVYEPHLIANFSPSERFDYFVSRWPYFTGYTSIMSFFYLLAYYEILEFNCVIIASCLHMMLLTVKGPLYEGRLDVDKKSPQYARYLPHVRSKWIVDPIDAIDKLVGKYL